VAERSVTDTRDTSKVRCGNDDDDDDDEDDDDNNDPA